MYHSVAPACVRHQLHITNSSSVQLSSRPINKFAYAELRAPVASGFRAAEGALSRRKAGFHFAGIALPHGKAAATVGVGAEYHHHGNLHLRGHGGGCGRLQAHHRGTPHPLNSSHAREPGVCSQPLPSCDGNSIIAKDASQPAASRTVSIALLSTTTVHCVAQWWS